MTYFAPSSCFDTTDRVKKYNYDYYLRNYKPGAIIKLTPIFGKDVAFIIIEYSIFDINGHFDAIMNESYWYDVIITHGLSLIHKYKRTYILETQLSDDSSYQEHRFNEAAAKDVSIQRQLWNLLIKFKAKKITFANSLRAPPFFATAREN